MILFHSKNYVANKVKRQVQHLHNEVVREFPHLAEESRKLIIRYLGQYEPQRLKVYLGELADGSEMTPWVSVERMHLASIQKLICMMMEDEANGEYDDTPFLVDAMIRKMLGVPFRSIQGGIS